MCQRDFITSQGVWASGALLHFDFRGGSPAGVGSVEKTDLQERLFQVLFGGNEEKGGIWYLLSSTWGFKLSLRRPILL